MSDRTHAVGLGPEPDSDRDRVVMSSRSLSREVSREVHHKSQSREVHHTSHSRGTEIKSPGYASSGVPGTSSPHSKSTGREQREAQRGGLSRSSESKETDSNSTTGRTSRESRRQLDFGARPSLTAGSPENDTDGVCTPTSQQLSPFSANATASVCSEKSDHISSPLIDIRARLAAARRNRLRPGALAMLASETQGVPKPRFRRLNMTHVAVRHATLTEVACERRSETEDESDGSKADATDSDRIQRYESSYVCGKDGLEPIATPPIGIRSLVGKPNSKTLSCAAFTGGGDSHSNSSSDGGGHRAVDIDGDVDFNADHGSDDERGDHDRADGGVYCENGSGDDGHAKNADASDTSGGSSTRAGDSDAGTKAGKNIIFKGVAEGGFAQDVCEAGVTARGVDDAAEAAGETTGDDDAGVYDNGDDQSDHRGDGRRDTHNCGIRGGEDRAVIAVVTSIENAARVDCVQSTSNIIITAVAIVDEGDAAGSDESLDVAEAGSGDDVRAAVADGALAARLVDDGLHDDAVQLQDTEPTEESGTGDFSFDDGSYDVFGASGNIHHLPGGQVSDSGLSSRTNAQTRRGRGAEHSTLTDASVKSGEARVRRPLRLPNSDTGARLGQREAEAVGESGPSEESEYDSSFDAIKYEGYVLGVKATAEHGGSSKNHFHQRLKQNLLIGTKRRVQGQRLHEHSIARTNPPASVSEGRRRGSKLPLSLSPEANLRPKLKLTLAKRKGRSTQNDGLCDYQVLRDGTLITEGFSLNAQGIVSTPQDELRRTAASLLSTPIDQSAIVKLGVLGTGSNGTVVKGIYMPTLWVVALKTVDIYDHQQRRQMVKELTAFSSRHLGQPNVSERTQGVGNKNVLNMLHAFFSDAKTTMVLEFMNRACLESWVNKHGPLAEIVVRRISKQIVLGLQCLHSRYQVHRDVKAANILIDAREHVKISDFGLFKQLEGSQALCETFVGTMMYFSPERIKGGEFSYPSDIWSLGLTVYFLAVGELPYEATNFWDLQALVGDGLPSMDSDKFSAELCDFFLCCVDPSPDARWTAEQLLKHPFIAQCHDDELQEAANANGDSHNGSFPFASLQDPDPLEIKIFIDAYLQYHAEARRVCQEANTLDDYDMACLAKVASQLGVSLQPLSDQLRKTLLQRTQREGNTEGSTTV